MCLNVCFVHSQWSGSKEKSQCLCPTSPEIRGEVDVVGTYAVGYWEGWWQKTNCTAIIKKKRFKKKTCNSSPLQLLHFWLILRLKSYTLMLFWYISVSGFPHFNCKTHKVQKKLLESTGEIIFLHLSRHSRPLKLLLTGPKVASSAS